MRHERKEHQGCADMPAQGNALGFTMTRGPALKGRTKPIAPLQGWPSFYIQPRALPWAGMLLGLWPEAWQRLKVHDTL